MIKVKPNLNLDKVPLSYKPGKPYTTGKIATADIQVTQHTYTPEQIAKAKQYWADKTKEDI